MGYRNSGTLKVQHRKMECLPRAKGPWFKSPEMAWNDSRSISHHLRCLITKHIQLNIRVPLPQLVGSAEGIKINMNDSSVIIHFFTLWNLVMASSYEMLPMHQMRCMH